MAELMASALVWVGVCQIGQMMYLQQFPETWYDRVAPFAFILLGYAIYTCRPKSNDQR